MRRNNTIWRPKMSMLAVLLMSATAFAVEPASGAGTGVREVAARPNVVLIMTDDQGYGDFGVQGNALIRTPQIDKMANASATMTQFYVSPVCSPTRACLMTGRYNYRTRCIDTYVGRSMVDPAETTVAEVLQGAGYATGVFGKWHLGDCYPMRPMEQGFEESLVHRGGGLAQPSEPPANGRRYTDPILFHNGQEVQTSGYCTDVYFSAAMTFIERCAKAERNFFVYLPTNAPHGPYHDVPAKWLDYYKNIDLSSVMVNAPKKPAALAAAQDMVARIFAMISNVDENVGRLTGRLDELQLTDNTIVIFLVDNGPNSARYVGPLRGRKSEVHEGGIRSPLWIRWPARLKAGASSDRVAAHIDLMPTVLDACGVAVPAGLRLDGRSLLPLLCGEKAEWPDRSIVIQSHRGDAPVLYNHFMIRGPRYKLLNASGFGREQLPNPPRFELYDIRNDPGETNNLVDQEPDVFARLKKAYEGWFQDVSSTRPDNYAAPRIHIGTPHENPTVLTRQDWRHTAGRPWGKTSIGHWELLVASPGPYDVCLRFDPESAPGSVELKITGVTKKAQLPADATEHTFRALTLPKGPAWLEAVLTHGGKPRGVYQVDVEH